MAAMDETHKSLWRHPALAILLRWREVLRAPIFGAALIAGLGLHCGSVEAGRWLPTVENPYCPVTTYTLRDVAEQASSMTDSYGRPVIVVNLRTLREHPSYGRFLMAHECCHHSLGHVGKFKQGLGGVGPQPFFYIGPALKKMELEADCCAVRLLKERQQADSVEAARSMMARFGDEPTGAHYPTGDERVENMLSCAETAE